jgi:hypothetical protein
MLKRKCYGFRSTSILGLILGSLPAYADGPYRLELSGGPSRIDSDISSLSASVLGSSQSIHSMSSKRFELGGEYFFRPLAADHGPLREAAFLERAPSLKLSFAESRADSESAMTWSFGGPTTETSSATRFETSEYQLRYRFVMPEKPWIGIASYRFTDRAAERQGVPSEWDDEHTRYSVGIGRYIGSRIAVTAEYGRSRLESSTSIGSPNAVGLSSLSIRDRTLTVGVHSVLELGARGHLGLTAALHETAFTGPAAPDDPARSYEVGVTYYPRNDVSLGLSALGRYDTDTALHGNLNEYKLEANWFVTPSIAVGLAYETADFRLGLVDPLGFPSGNENSSSGFRFNFTWRH